MLPIAARRAGIKLEPLLSRVGLTIDQIDDPEQRINARSQIAFLETVAEELNDDFLGLTLAEEFDCRDLGLLYYVMASSDTLGDALKRVSRYSRITNEAIVLQYREAREPALRSNLFGHPAACRSASNRILHCRGGPHVSPADRSAAHSQARIHDSRPIERHL